MSFLMHRSFGILRPAPAVIMRPSLSVGNRGFTTAKDVEQQVKDIVATEVATDSSKLQNNTRFVRDLRVGRAGLRRLRFKFQKAFETDISDADAKKMSTIQDTVNYFSTLRR